MLMSYITLSTFFAGGFIRSMIKIIVELMRNTKLSARKVSGNGRTRQTEALCKYRNLSKRRN